MLLPQLPARAKAYNEESITRALNRLENGDFKSLRQASALTGVPYATLQRRRQGAKPRTEAHQPEQLLSAVQERVLVDWIKRNDNWGFPPRLWEVEEKGLLLAGKNPSLTTIGKHWVDRFVTRNPDIRKYIAGALDR